MATIDTSKTITLNLSNKGKISVTKTGQQYSISLTANEAFPAINRTATAEVTELELKDFVRSIENNLLPRPEEDYHR